jgi:hypothetical protein
MFRKVFSSITTGILVFLLTIPALQAQATQVKIIGPAIGYTSHDITTIATDLGQMLSASPGYSGSSASATVLSGLSLIEAFYHPSYRTATRTAVDTKHDYLVILPETIFYTSFPEATFEGVLQLSRRALNVCSKPLLLMPRGGSLSINALGENSYRIGNGCGIDVVPGGYAVEAAGLANPGSNTTNLRRQAYLLAATLFTKITGLNAATNTTYAPSDVGNSTVRGNLAATAVTENDTHATSAHYSTSRYNTGAVRYRTVTPPSGTAWQPIQAV